MKDLKEQLKNIELSHEKVRVKHKKYSLKFSILEGNYVDDTGFRFQSNFREIDMDNYDYVSTPFYFEDDWIYNRRDFNKIENIKHEILFELNVGGSMQFDVDDYVKFIDYNNIMFLNLNHKWYVVIQMAFQDFTMITDVLFNLVSVNKDEIDSIDQKFIKKYLMEE